MLHRRGSTRFRAVNGIAFAAALALALGAAGCIPEPADPAADRAESARVALDRAASRPAPPERMTPADAVRYALANNLDIQVAAIDLAYQEEATRGVRMRMLPRLQADIDLSTRNHYDASYSERVGGGAVSVPYSYSRDRTTYPMELAAVWNLLDFGTGYLRARQTGEKALQSREQLRRVRHRVAMETLSAYWRAAAATENAREAALLIAEMEEQTRRVREARERGALSAAEASRRELTLLNAMIDADQWERAAEGAVKDLARAMASPSTELSIAEDAGELAPPILAETAGTPLPELFEKALHCRPELYQGDSQARISLDEARLALLQMAPNANLSLALNYNDDSHLYWNDWATAGLRVTWNLLSIPARLSERRAALLQEEADRTRTLAMSAAVLAQVGIAHGEWLLAERQHERLLRRAETRRELVSSLELTERDGRTRSSDVLQERVRLLSETAAVRMKRAETLAAQVRLASAVGLELDVE